ncbi:MAG: hypothetical protein VW496_02290 [Pelagibacteraceae bacterium]
MFEYKVFQINLTDREIKKINQAGDHSIVPKNDLRLKINCSFGNDVTEFVKEAFEKKYYQHVATISTVSNSLEHVFEIGNIGPDEFIERILPMHSISVGDVIESPNGDKHMVASVGFEKVTL